MTPATLTTVKEALAVAKVKYTREMDNARVRMEAYPRPEEMGWLEEMTVYFAGKVEAVDAAWGEIQQMGGANVNEKQ